MGERAIVRKLKQRIEDLERKLAESQGLVKTIVQQRDDEIKAREDYEQLVGWTLGGLEVFTAGVDQERFNIADAAYKRRVKQISDRQEHRGSTGG